MSVLKVLIVEDNALSAKYFADVVQLMGHAVCGTASTADDAIDIALTHQPDVMLMDVRLIGPKDGVDAALAIQQHLTTKVIYITASTDKRTMARIKADHPFDVLTKPVLTSDLERAIASALH